MIEAVSGALFQTLWKISPATARSPSKARVNNTGRYNAQAMKNIHRFPHEVRVIENCWIPLSDGCVLAARIWLPADAENAPVPAILEYIPYRKRDFTRARDEPMHHYF